MFCNKCGSPIREGNSFCSNCGNPVSVASAPIPTYVPPAVPTEVPAHDRPPVSSYSKTYNYENDSSETFLFAAPDLDMATPAPKKSSEPVYIPPLDPVEEPVVVEAAPEPEVKGPKLKNGKRQFNLIMPTELYDQLQTAAAEDDRSLNSFIVLALKKFIAQNG